METPLVSIILNVNTVNSKYERGIFQAPREKHKWSCNQLEGEPKTMH